MHRKHVCFIVSIFVVGLGNFVSAQENSKIDSIEKIMPTLKGQIKFDALRDLFSLYNQFDYNRSFEVSTEALKTAKETGDSLLIIRSYRMNGYALMNLAKNPQAIEVFQKALDLAASDKSNSKVKNQIKFILNSIALAYTDMGNYPKALDFHFKSLVIREAEGNKLDISIAFNNIGLVYYRMSNYQKAIDFYSQCLKIKRELGDNTDNDKSLLLINIALCDIELNNFEKAISIIKEVLYKCGNNCSEDIKREAFNSLGIAYFKTGKMEKAKIYFYKALETARFQNNLPAISSNLISLGKIDQQKGKVDNAIDLLKETEVVLRDTNYPKVQLELYSTFFKLYLKEKNVELASVYQEKYVHLNNEVFRKDLINNLIVAQTNYAEREDIKTIKEQAEIMLFKQQLIDRQRVQFFYIVLVAFLTLGCAVVLLFDSKAASRTLGGDWFGKSKK